MAEKKKILLIAVKTYSNLITINQGLGYTAVPLIKMGYQVEIMDPTLTRCGIRDILKKINEEQYSIIGIGGVVAGYNFFVKLTKQIKRHFPEIKIIVGGYMANSISETILKRNPVDMVVLGESEQTLPELIPLLEENQAVDTVRGLTYIREGSVVKNPPRPLIKDLDTLPYIPYELFQMEDIIKFNSSIPILFARGCNHRCSFCFQPWEKYRNHSAEYSVGLIKYLQKKYTCHDFMFIDENFGVKKKWLHEFSEMILRDNVNINFKVAYRANEAREEDLRLLKRIGCSQLFFGLESGSQRMLDSMNKKATIEKYERAINAVRSLDMGFACNFILGMPGETAETIAETRDFIVRNKLGNANVVFATPYPGTEIYKYCVKKQLIKDEHRFSQIVEDHNYYLINMTELSMRYIITQSFKIQHLIFQFDKSLSLLQRLLMTSKKKIADILLFLGLWALLKNLRLRAKERRKKIIAYYILFKGYRSNWLYKMYKM